MIITMALPNPQNTSMQIKKKMLFADVCGRAIKYECSVDYIIPHIILEYIKQYLLPHYIAFRVIKGNRIIAGLRVESWT